MATANFCVTAAGKLGSVATDLRNGQIPEKVCTSAGSWFEAKLVLLWAKKGQVCLTASLAAATAGFMLATARYVENETCSPNGAYTRKNQASNVNV